MTTFKVTVEDEQANTLRKILRAVPFVNNIEEENLTDKNKTKITESSYERIKKILDEAKRKNLFKDIENPSEWQREIRKEWDRDF